MAAGGHLRRADGVGATTALPSVVLVVVVVTVARAGNSDGAAFSGADKNS